MAFVVLIAAFLLNGAANVALKYGANQVTASGRALWPAAIQFPVLWLGVAMFAANIVLYVWALSKLPLSIAYPIMQGGALLVVALATFLVLHERVTLADLIGVALIVSGITVLTATH